MKNLSKKLMVTCAFAALTFTGSALAFQAKVPPPTATGPTDEAIAAAKRRGLVWVDTKLRVYYKDGALYGKSSRGEFMPEDEAKKAGYHQATK